MESRDGVSTSSGGVTVVGSDAPSDFHVAPRSGNSTPVPGSAPAPPAAGAPAAAPPQVGAAPPQVGVAPPQEVMGMPMKKKRGRPRKYGPDGPMARALSPKPISSSAPPPVIDFSAHKRGKLKPAALMSKPKFKVEGLGIGSDLNSCEWVACSVGANFTPHIITVNTGEDVMMKIISFSQQGPRAICILSANGVISSVTLRQPDSSGGTLTYEGRFEILSLSGSFMPNESGGTRSRSGGMSVSLASPDGRVIGGGIAGLLVAAGPVQVVVGSFLAGNQHEQKPKKPQHDFITAATSTAIVPISSADPRGSISTSPTYHADSWSTMPSDSRSRPTDINVSFS